MPIEPQIQYATTDDDVRIGYVTFGHGPPLVLAPGEPFSQILLAWQVPAWLEFYERLAQRRQIVVYDGRGTGVSGKVAIESSVETQVLDLAAVLDRLRLETFTLFAPLNAGPSAIAYAVTHPEWTGKLILWCSYAKASDFFGSRAWQSLEKLMADDWDLFVQTVSHTRFGTAVHESPGFSVALRSSVTPRTMQGFIEGNSTVDVTPLLNKVSLPTLVLHRQDLHVGPNIEIAISLASQIPSARLVVLEGTSVAPYQGNVETVLSAIDEFLGDAEPSPPPAEPVDPAARTLPEPLSEREMQVLRLIADGLSNQNIANQLVIANGTVKTHINKIYGKMEVRSRTQAIAKARVLNLI